MMWLAWIASTWRWPGSWRSARGRRSGWGGLPSRGLWVLALVKLVMPPLATLPIGGPSGAVACALGVCSCGPHAGAPTFMRFTLPWVLLAVWSAGAGVTLAIALQRWTHFCRLLAHATPAPARCRRLAAQLGRELALRRPPTVLTILGRLPPMVVPGWRAPKLLVPAGLIGRLNAAQREALVLHELVHIKRGDHLVRFVELAVGVAFWWLPIVGSMGRRLRACEEACCDAAVVARRPRARRHYARLILDVIDFADPLPRQAAPQATTMSAAEGLEDRLRTVLDGGRAAPRRSYAGAMAMGLACIVLPAGVRYDVPTPTESAPRNAEACAAELCGETPEMVEIRAFCCPQWE